MSDNCDSQDVKKTQESREKSSNHPQEIIENDGSKSKKSKKIHYPKGYLSRIP